MNDCGCEMESLPCSVNEVATARIRAEFRKRELSFDLTLERLKNRYDNLRNGAFQLQAKLAFHAEIRSRARFAWHTWHALLVAERTLKRPLGDAVKRRLRAHLTTESADLLSAWNKTPGLEAEDLDAQREPLIAEAFAEVDFGIDSQDRTSERLVKLQILGALGAAFLGGLMALAAQAWLGGEPVAVTCTAPPAQSVVADTHR